MLNFFKFFLQKRQFTYLLMIGITALGVFSVVSIPKESAPEVRIPMGIVSTVLPGASAEEVERLVTNKVEDGLNNLDDLDKITSSSREGVSIVTVEFTANADLDKSIRSLKDEVDKIKSDLPSEALDPQVLEINFADQPMFILSVSSDLPPTEFATLANKLKDEIKAIPGVSKVEKSGVRERQVQVIVDKEKLATYGLRIADVVSALAATNSSLPVGSLTVDKISYAVRFAGDIKDPSQIRDIAILNLNGEPVYVRDIAVVSEGVEDASTLSRISVGNKPSSQSIALSVYKKSGGSITQVAATIKDRVEELKPTLLKNATVLYSFDSAQRVKDDLFELVRAGLETIVLVMVSLFLTLGWREAIIAGLSIPLSFLIAFVGLYYSGNTINFISLFSLILAVGILVDSGIVVVESIHTRLRKHGQSKLAATETIEEYGWPLIAGTMTNAAVFIPLFFISGIVGKFIASIPFTVMFVLMASIFVSLAFLPILSVVFLRPDKKENKLTAWQETYTHKVQDWYRTKLNQLLGNKPLENKLLKWVAGAFIIAMLIPITGLVKATFFPQGDLDYVYVQIEKAQGTSLSDTDLATRAVEEILYKQKDIDSFITTVGAGSSFDESSLSGSRYANITINLNKNRHQTSSEFVDNLRQSLNKIKNADVRVSQPNSGPPVGTPVQIKFLGKDLTRINQVAAKAETILKKTKGAKEVISSSRDDLPDFVLTIDKAKASQYGLNSLSVAQTLRMAVYGVEATSIKTQDQTIKVMVKMNLNPNYQATEETSEATLDSLNQLAISSPRGPVLLGSILTTSIEKSNSVIAHENRDRLVTVSSQLADGVTASEVVKEFKKHQKELGLGNDVSISYGGETEEVNKSFLDMFKALLIGILLIFAILILLFNSIRYSVYLLIIVPLSIIGVFFGLFVSGYALSFPSILGFIALAGTIVNHTIILIDSMNLSRRRHPDQDLKQVVVEASVVRLRPIVLTTITTVLGMIPLAFVSPTWGPLAFSVMFGLTFAIVLTLVLLPVLYYRWPGKLSQD